MKSFYNHVQVRFKSDIQTIRSDNAGEFTDASCKEFYAAKGITHQTSCVNRPQQNARVERRHRYVLEVARCLRFQAGLQLSFWGECVLAAVYIINRLPTPTLENKTSYETLFEEPVDYDKVKVFGCLAFAANPANIGDKFGPRRVPCVFVGYPFSQKGYTLLNLTTMQTFVSRDAVFHKSVFSLNNATADSYIQPTPVVMPNSTAGQYTYDDIVVSEDTYDANTENHASSSAQIPLRHSSRVAKKPAWLADYVHNVQSSNVVEVVDLPIENQFQCFSATVSTNTDPVHFKKALQHPHWMEAMNSELTALEENETWAVTTHPPGKKSIGCRWVFKTKYNPDGSIERYKARLVVLGNKQIYGIDYAETFAHVAKLTTV